MKEGKDPCFRFPIENERFPGFPNDTVEQIAFMVLGEKLVDCGRKKEGHLISDAGTNNIIWIIWFGIGKIAHSMRTSRVVVSFFESGAI